MSYTDKQLSQHFKLSEFVESSIARNHGIDNGIYLTDDIEEKLATLVKKVLESLRVETGCPIHVDSGYRCPQLNKLVGGVENSQHLLGMAADIICPDYAVPHGLFDFIANNFDFDQVILYPTFVHVSYNEGKNRHEKLRAHTGDLTCKH